MLIKTHLVISIFFILLLTGHVTSPVLFVALTLLSTFIPDADSRFSKLGQRKSLRIFQWFVKHRGIMHSFTFCLLFTLFFVLFLPVVALPFFLGYSSHLLADSFTVEGIKPFYPWEKTSSWKIRTGGKTETSVFMLFVLVDLFLLLVMFFG